MATTVRETIADFGRFDPDLHAPEPRRLRPAYGFDDIAIVPGVETLHPDDVDLSWELGGHRFAIPFIASAMDGVVNVPFAVALGKLGGLAVLNLEGLQSRYADPEEPLAEIAAAPRETVTELMETGIAGLLVGVGPGAACTSREVLGIGVPQVTATLDCAAARDAFYGRTGRYVPIVTDGGMRTGGDVCKAFASGADAVMIGSPFAQTAEAPGRGHHWGMAAPHAGLPRGTRIKVGVGGSLEQILFGPTSLTNGTQNLVGALRTCMGVVGAATIQEMHQAEMVIAPAIKTEGKSWQLAGA